LDGKPERGKLKTRSVIATAKMESLEGIEAPEMHVAIRVPSFSGTFSLSSCCVKTIYKL
jgi:hypothetical protein